ncbi:hypothetical protein UFOVP33_52 [uncultured Caudovirales phage]|uniref:Uncharacterized protein n=1 Tax=uncultured Caudovirales phage TaxID=2100421 RepID=A0A6J5KNQ1_9CAUD|nr:hypothetical protein UFOVP33_52 [uncultured Caudovirales phage]
MSGKPQSYRSRVLRVVNASPDWLRADEIAKRTSLTYHQTIYALNALYNFDLVARLGSKRGSRWGSLVLIEHNPGAEAAKTLEEIFRGFATNHS